jgi:hypothetical protein
MMDALTRKKLARSLRRRAFDLTVSGIRDGVSYVRPWCSRCAAMVINGVACHETGCPNDITARKRRR